jgi:hypothetical protein
MTVEHGATDQSVTVIAEDTAGARVLSLDETDFTITYRRGVNGALVSVTAVSLAAITTVHTDGGVKALGNTEAPGAVRVDLPDAIFATGASYATVHLVIAGARPQDLLVELVTPVTITAGRVSSKVEVIDNDVITNAAIQDNAISAAKIASAAITAAKFAAGAIDAAAIATDAIGSAEIAASAVTKIQTGLATATALDDVEIAVASVGTVTNKLDDTLEDDGGTFRFTTNALEQAPSGTGASAASIRAEMDSNSTQLAKLGTPAGASISADILAVKNQTAAIETDTQDLQGRTPAALVSGRMDASVGAYQTGLTPLQPTTAGRTLDVTATGEAGVDWANIGSPTTTVNLSGTTVKTATDVEADTVDIQGRLPAALSSGRMDASVGAYQTGLTPGVKKNTALANFPFLMVDATDGVTPETLLTVTATRSLDGAAFGACANAVVEIASGWYKINLAAGDLNGDTVVLRFTAAGARNREFIIVTET